MQNRFSQDREQGVRAHSEADPEGLQGGYGEARGVTSSFREQEVGVKNIQTRAAIFQILT